MEVFGVKDKIFGEVIIIDIFFGLGGILVLFVNIFIVKKNVEYVEWVFYRIIFEIWRIFEICWKCMYVLLIGEKIDKNLCVFVKMVMISLNFIWKIKKKIMVCDLLLLVVICVGLYFKINYMKKKI